MLGHICRSFVRNNHLKAYYTFTLLLSLPTLCRCMCGNSQSIMASPVTVKPSSKHTASVIFLHGLGDTGHGWCAAMEEIREPHIKYICPTASVIPVTLNGGFKMPSWFDIKSLSFAGDEDRDGILDSSNQLQALIEEEVQSGIDRSRIIVGGFSQGGAIALYSALTDPQPLGGVVCLSCWLPLHSTFPQACKGNNNFPIFQAHGNADNVINYKYGQMTATILSSLCTRAEFKTYPGLTHSSSPEELKAVKSFIAKTVPPTP